MYNKVDQHILTTLERIVGVKNVLVSAEAIAPYTHDETVGVKGIPELVVRVESASQITKIFKLAQQQRIPITPRGAGYGLSGGAVAAYGGILLSLERMNHILEIDQENLMVTVEPGVITGDIHRAVEQQGLFYPPDPASLDSCSIGGNIAEGAGGPRAVKYGVTMHYVCGLEVVLPNGEIIQCGGKLVKNVTGYNLIQLIIGSEGTLGIVTKIILRLIPLPKIQIDLLVPFSDFQNAADTVNKIIAARIVPACLEFMQQDSIIAVERLTGKKMPFDQAAAHLLIQLDGNLREAVESEMEIVGDLCMQHGAIDVLVAKDRATRDRLWDGRRKIIDAINHESPVNHMEDVVVPRAEIPTLLGEIQKLAQKYEIRIISFGHAGDGNVHVNALKDQITEQRWQKIVPRLTEDIYRLSLALGGTITGEHGIGLTRKNYLSLALEPAQILIMRQIRQAFDPHNILNPGKIFP